MCAFPAIPRAVRRHHATDAWGEPDDPEEVQAPSGHRSAAAPTPAIPRRRALQYTPTFSSKPNAATVSKPASPARKPEACSTSSPTRSCARVPSLQKLCLGQLSRHVDEVVEQLGEATSWLPPHLRACLLAAARRRGVLTDAMLALLLDNSFTLLDLSSSNVTDAGVQAALSQLPLLEALDISRCNHLSARTLRVAAECCPRLRTLRIGGSVASDEAAAVALKHILPRIERAELQGQSSPCFEDSWEDAADEAAMAQTGRMYSLQYIVWPGIPLKARKMMMSLCPRIHLNPPPSSTVASTSPGSATAQGAAVAPIHAASLTHSIPIEALEGTPLDEPLARQVGSAAWEGLGGHMVVDPDEELPLHEKFRRAFIERAAAVKLREQRSYEQWQRRQLRGSAALRAMASWLDE